MAITREYKFIIKCSNCAHITEMARDDTNISNIKCSNCKKTGTYNYTIIRKRKTLKEFWAQKGLNLSMRYLKKKYSKTKSKPKKITILYDDRERNPWRIDHPDFKFERQRLIIGDYTIKGYEDIVAIEKKSGIIELISNLASKDRPRFKKFLAKLSQYELKYMIIEDSLCNIDKAFRMNRRTHLTPTSIYYWLSIINIQYGIPTLFIGNNKRHQEEFLYYFFVEIMKKLKEK